MKQTAEEIDVLRSEVARLRAVSSSVRATVGDAVIETDADGRLVSMSASAESLTGWSCTDAAGSCLKDLIQIVDDLTHQRVEDPVSRVLAGGAASSLVAHSLVARDGKRIPIEHRACLIHDEEGKVLGVVVVFCDLSERRRADEARRDAERLRRLEDEFMAMVSYELRAPLTSIIGWAQLLKSCFYDEDRVRRGIEIIASSGKTQAHTIQEMLDIWRIITGKIRVGKQEVTVRSLLENAIDMAKPSADEKRISLELIVAAEVATIVGDSDRLTKALHALVSNAVKFTPMGGRVSVAATQSESEILITVTDTGLGISSSSLPYVFDRFAHANPSASRSQHGLGLGLAIVRRLVELHGGSVRADSEGEGRGARFTLALPLVPRDGLEPRSISSGAKGHAIDDTEADSVPPEYPADPHDALALRGLRLLVIDDDGDARELLSLVLQHHGAQVTMVESAHDAMEALDRSAPDLIVCDIGMPGEDGYTFIRRVRTLQKGVARVPAIALTAYARVEDRRQAVAAGFQLHVAKPIDPPELVTAIALLVRTEPLLKKVMS